jgi:hypothetical protein
MADGSPRSATTRLSLIAASDPGLATDLQLGILVNLVGLPGPCSVCPTLGLHCPSWGSYGSCLGY